MVFSLSFGSERRFVLKPKELFSKTKEENTDSITKEISITNGMGLLMGGLCQTTHKHSIPKVNGNKGLLLGKRIIIDIDYYIYKDNSHVFSVKF